MEPVWYKIQVETATAMGEGIFPKAQFTNLSEAFTHQHDLEVVTIIHPCVLGSPLQEDSLAGSPYVLSVGSPERSPSSLPSPSTRHLIYRNDHDLRESEDDPHTVRTPESCSC